MTIVFKVRHVKIEKRFCIASISSCSETGDAAWLYVRDPHVCPQAPLKMQPSHSFAFSSFRTRTSVFLQGFYMILPHLPLPMLRSLPTGLSIIVIVPSTVWREKSVSAAKRKSNLFEYFENNVYPQTFVLAQLTVLFTITALQTCGMVTIVAHSNTVRIKGRHPLPHPSRCPAIHTRKSFVQNLNRFPDTFWPPLELPFQNMVNRPSTLYKSKHAIEQDYGQRRDTSKTSHRTINPRTSFRL